MATTTDNVRYIRRSGVLPALSREELLRECRAKEDALIRQERELRTIGEALWPAGDSERPDWFDENGTTPAELIAGIHSLHEYCNRLLDENDALRTRLEVSHD